MEIEKKESYKSNKVVDLDDAERMISKFKNSGKKVGLCHGGFDLLHPGHVKHFESAKKLCDILMVSITSDKFVQSRKGSGRPIFPDQLRAYMVANVLFVDYVIITDFKEGVDVIKRLKPTYYIKGPDFINKQTPGIISERNAIAEIGGEIRYTDDPKLATTEIINYIKGLDLDEILVIIDRDGTLIEDVNFLGRNNDWKSQIKLNESVLSILSYLQTKYKTLKIVITNQAGVARGYFDCERVKEINNYLNELIKKRGIIINDWQFCPDVDKDYANSIDTYFDNNFVKPISKRKPSPEMVHESLIKIGRKISDFDKILVIGDREEDKELANNIKALFIHQEIGYSKSIEMINVWDKK